MKINATLFIWEHVCARQKGGDGHATVGSQFMQMNCSIRDPIVF